jgi:hypothetical protein
MKNTLVEIVEKRTGLDLQDLPKNAKHEVGETYYSCYWQQTYTVIDIKKNVPVWGEVYVCKWDDGHITEHSTQLKPDKDFQYWGLA